jgi:predicted AlkP superfamily pyrophosphatase or phosphodiesterase
LIREVRRQAIVHVTPGEVSIMVEAYDMRAVAPTVCSILGVRHPRNCKVKPLLEVLETMGIQERLAVVVVDAFGVSTWTAARMETPTFNALANRHLLHLRSVMPTITPVNFATMVTGASPEVHLISTRDDDLVLETVFDVLRCYDKTSATAARALSSLGILISSFADQGGLAVSNTDEEVCSIAVDALKERVDLLWVQLLDVDDAGHEHGPLSSQGIAAAKRADAYLKEIVSEACKRGYALIVLADHGQHTITGDDGRKAGTHGTRMEEDVYVPFIWCGPDEAARAMGIS